MYCPGVGHRATNLSIAPETIVRDKRGGGERQGKARHWDVLPVAQRHFPTYKTVADNSINASVVYFLGKWATLPVAGAIIKWRGSN